MSVLCVAAVLLFSVCGALSQSCSSPDAEVLILGGGMAGISAANRLSELGITDFIVFEAQAEIGGRLKTEEIVPGVKINIGANWIQGVDREAPELHPLFALAQKCGGIEGIYSDSDDITIYNASGVDITESSSLRYLEFESATDSATSLSEDLQDSGQPDISTRQGLTRGNWTPITPEDKWVEWFHFDFCFAEPPDVSSLIGTINVPTYRDFLQNPDNEGRDYLITDQRGFNYLVECLASDFSTGSSDNRVRKSATVGQIQYSDDCVCVTVSENDSDNKYCAPYAILTFGIGVLKSDEFGNKISPPLPAKKEEAMDLIGSAHFLNIVALYEERFWNSTEYVGYVDSQRGFYPLFQPLNTILPGGVNAVRFTLTGEVANRVVQQDSAATVQEITEFLRRIYGDEVPEPTSILLGDFYTNPLFLGSYSNVRVGVSEATFQELNSPEGRLYFAGEAFQERYSGFVHGAMLSGIDTANVVGSKISSGFNLVASYNMLLVLFMASMIFI